MPHSQHVAVADWAEPTCEGRVSEPEGNVVIREDFYIAVKSTAHVLDVAATGSELDERLLAQGVEGQDVEIVHADSTEVTDDLYAEALELYAVRSH